MGKNLEKEFFLSSIRRKNELSFYLNYFLSFLDTKNKLPSILLGYFQKVFSAMMDLKNVEVKFYLILVTNKFRSINT
jgi:hypothetical protein